MSGSYYKIIHTWNLNRQEAFDLQAQLAGQVIQTSGIKTQNITTVAGVDTHYHQGNAIAAVVTLKLIGLEVVEQATAVQPVKFPYIPGLLSFREGPVVLDAIKKLASPPDALIFDGQGIAHPRRFGLACHMGLWVDIPPSAVPKNVYPGAIQNRIRPKAVILISEMEKTSSEPSSGRARKSNHYLYLSAMASVWRIAFVSY